MPPDDIRIYRRNLPHWRVDAAVYFVTWRVARNQPPLTAAERHQVVETLRRSSPTRCELLAYVVMDDHVHVLVQPQPEYELERLLHTWKSFTAHQFQHAGRRGAVWQREYFDRIVRDDRELDAKIQYILGNPFHRWPEIEDYAWLWCREDLFE